MELNDSEPDVASGVSTSTDYIESSSVIQLGLSVEHYFSSEGNLLPFIEIAVLY